MSGKLGWRSRSSAVRDAANLCRPDYFDLTEDRVAGMSNNTRRELTADYDWRPCKRSVCYPFHEFQCKQVNDPHRVRGTVLFVM